MATLASQPSAVGDWLTLEEGAATLRALTHDDMALPENPLTIYWPAKRDARRFAQFFNDALPRVREPTTGGRRLERRVAYQDDGTAFPFGSQLPPTAADAAFLRMEHLAGRPDSERFVFVVWCNLAAGNRVTVPDDAAGVLLQARHLTALLPSLSDLISQTSANQPSLSEVQAMLTELDNHLSDPGAPQVQAG